MGLPLLPLVWLLLVLCCSPLALAQSTPSVFQVTGSLSGADFVVQYSFQASGTLLSGVVGSPSATYLVQSVAGTRTFTNTTTSASTVASLTLLPLFGNEYNNNTLYPNSPTVYNNHTLFDWDGLAFSLSVPEHVAGFTNQTFSVVGLWWDSTASSPSYTEDGAGVNVEQGITSASFAATPVSSTSGASSSSSTGLPSPSSSSAVPSSSASAVFDVAGTLTGSDFVVDYSFQASGSLLSGTVGTASAAYLILSVAGTRTVTNTTTGASAVASLTLLPVGLVGLNNNTLYPNAPKASSNHSILDLYGLAFSFSQPVEVAGYSNITFSSLNLFWFSTLPSPQYSEAGNGTSFEAGITTASFTATPVSSVSVLGDPQFVGLCGQSFQVHGIDGEVYNLIVERGEAGRGPLLVNSRFRFLSSGRCPAVEQPNKCWSHPGSYLGELGVVSPAGGRLHVASGSWESGFGALTLNGRELTVGSAVSELGIFVHVLSAYSLTLSVGNFIMQLENSDRFVNLVELEVRHWSKLSSHGLLGQTWRTPRKPGSSQLSAIEGDVDDYAEKSSDLFGSDFVYGVGAD